MAFVDPFDRCLDNDVGNNLAILPVNVNYTECIDYMEADKCKFYEDYMKTGTDAHNIIQILGKHKSSVGFTVIIPNYFIRLK